MAALAGIVESTLAGMGYEMVDTQVSNHGRLVRVFIDRPRGSGSGVTVDDCAVVSRQLTHLLAVEGIDYDRLEVSSPGLDRPLRKPADFERFAGRRVDIRMRTADANGRRHFCGRLQGIAQGIATVEVDGRDVALKVDDMVRAKLVPTV